MKLLTADLDIRRVQVLRRAASRWHPVIAPAARATSTTMARPVLEVTSEFLTAVPRSIRDRCAVRQQALESVAIGQGHQRGKWRVWCVGVIWTLATYKHGHVKLSMARTACTSRPAYTSYFSTMIVNNFVKFFLVFSSDAALAVPPLLLFIITSNICWATSVLLNVPFPFSRNQSA